MNSSTWRASARILSTTALLVTCLGCASSKLATFDTPDKAMWAIADAVGTDDSQRVEELFGEDGIELIRSGDEVADHEDAVRVQQGIREKLAFEDHGEGTKVALIGNDAWPFPIPLVQEGGRWHFDVEAGVEEVARRRVGRNELLTLASLHAYVDAQREYVATGHDGRPAAYARKVISSEGKHDGLYWPVAAGEAESPLGPLMAAAADEGYRADADGDSAYHGYHFRTLSAQGASAPGGAKSYLDAQGNMTRGYAMLAWPAKYRSSGVMTFLVGPQGIVYQKDLGADTDSAVARIQAFDPDLSWDPTGD
jgi:hypothetical protein